MLNREGAVLDGPSSSAATARRGEKVKDDDMKNFVPRVDSVCPPPMRQIQTGGEVSEQPLGV